ncbi:MAG: hypothetical protein HY286_04045 [Planctomycetes bacterium]|nr:hypothetical protein [Planctomycetota bacterium]
MIANPGTDTYSIAKMETGTALAVSAAVALLLILIAPELRLVDRPGGRHEHRHPTPRVGGLAVAAGLAAAGFLFQLSFIKSPAALGGLCFLIIGAFDDVLRDRFPWLVKFAMQAGALILYSLQFSGASAAFCAVFLWLIVNAYNFFDHADGLLAIALVPPILALPSPLCACALAALAPVAILNFRGKLFLGDAGSHALSFFIIASILEGPERELDLLSLGPAAVLASLPLLDFAFVIAIRLFRRTPPWRSTPDHLANRIVRAFDVRWIPGCLAGLWTAYTVGIFISTADGFDRDTVANVGFAGIAVVSLIIVFLGSPPRRAKIENAAPPG